MLLQACEGAVAEQVEDARQVRCIEPDVIVRFGQGKVEMFNGLVEGSTIRQTARWHCVFCIEGLLLDLASGCVGGDLFVFGRRCRQKGGVFG